MNILAIIRTKIFGRDWVGAYLVANNTCLLYPHGLDKKLLNDLEKNFEVLIPVSIHQSYLLGAYIVMNSNGILLPKITHEDEIEKIKKNIGDSIQVGVLNSLNNALGNLILYNDKGAVISSFLRKHQGTISDVLGVEVTVYEFGGNHLPGSNGIANNNGCCIHPLSSDEDVNFVSETLKVDTDVSTVNRGYPNLGYGLVVNDSVGIFGTNSTGPEMMRLTNMLVL